MSSAVILAFEILKRGDFDATNMFVF